MKIRIKLRNGQRIIAKSYGYGAVDCRGRFYHRNHYKLVEVLHNQFAFTENSVRSLM